MTRAAAGVRYRRSPHIVCYWSDEGLVFENYATGLRTGTAPLISQILDFFDDWRPVEDLYARFKQIRPESLLKAVRALEGRSLLQRSDAVRKVERDMETWAAWNPHAGFLHFSTKDVPYVPDVEVGERRLREKARARPMPPHVKRYPRVRFTPLPGARKDGEFPQVLLARRTWRRFSRKPLDLADLGTLLGLTWGVQQWMSLPGLPRAPLKTSPSGGARHPLEAYVLSVRVKGLPRGLYHYAPDRHGLERLASKATSAQIVRYLGSQSWYRGASALVLMTAVFPRTQWRYDYPRAYRAVLLEAGHFCQTFCLVATWLGLAPFCSMALADSRIEKDLGLDGVTESVLYAAGVGTRPRDTGSPHLPMELRRAERRKA